MAWVSPLEPHKRHQDIRQKRLKGAGNWFLLQPEFQKWSDGNIGSVLACSGIPGAGKSVIWFVVNPATYTGRKLLTLYDAVPSCSIISALNSHREAKELVSSAYIVITEMTRTRLR
jgi:hypothetical protein